MKKGRDHFVTQSHISNKASHLFYGFSRHSISSKTGYLVTHNRGSIRPHLHLTGHRYWPWYRVHTLYPLYSVHLYTDQQGVGSVPAVHAGAGELLAGEGGGGVWGEGRGRLPERGGAHHLSLEAAGGRGTAEARLAHVVVHRRNLQYDNIIRQVGLAARSRPVILGLFSRKTGRCDVHPPPLPSQLRWSFQR